LIAVAAVMGLFGLQQRQARSSAPRASEKHAAVVAAAAPSTPSKAAASAPSKAAAPGKGGRGTIAQASKAPDVVMTPPDATKLPPCLGGVPTPFAAPGGRAADCGPARSVKAGVQGEVADTPEERKLRAEITAKHVQLAEQRCGNGECGGCQMLIMTAPKAEKARLAALACQSGCRYGCEGPSSPALGLLGVLPAR
jgi:hypothetical protein